MHEVTPVLKGSRYAFLPFLYDDAAAEIREANNGYLDESVGQYRPDGRAWRRNVGSCRICHRGRPVRDTSAGADRRRRIEWIKRDRMSVSSGLLISPAAG
jgi:hypothetical protein